MKTENGKDIARWMGLVDEMINEEAQANNQTQGKKGVDPVQKNREGIEKLQKDIMQQKFQLLNAKIKDLYLSKNSETTEEEMMKFQFIDRGDYYEFTIPINVLFGAKTRKDCAVYWDDFFDKCDIHTSFLDNINDAVDKISNINLTMKLIVKDGKVEEKQ